ncbi:PRC-barrel domain-containing protein [Streptomyces sp. JJ36]|uniref:PRC-barrel domain-containing protein n=1 Tax=Streptomyces sp. JJ36 TaxID=2736645 RepID=UPI001F2A068E|nr:PRC-barrel domain-containing protein [Streptomyces sp. JJ36]MCF6525222.1 PRC-barrel domain-containing protein [Streptomyces sp. JJ36]
MRLHDMTGRTVMGVTDATTLGAVTGFLVDPEEPRVAGLRLRKPGGGSTLLAWSAVRAVGADAVMADPDEAGRTARQELGPLAGKRYEITGKRVLSERGEELGAVEDAEFDPESGALVSVSTPGEEIDAGRIAGLGSYALVVRSA